MLIRTQNKTAIINLNQIDVILYDDYNNAIFAHNGDAVPMELGDYSTKEKAIKVLDMIQNQYQYCQECKYFGSGSSQPEFVFQMPERMNYE